MAGALLEKAESLIDNEIHPVIIADGYNKVQRQATKLLLKIAKTVTPKDRGILEKIAKEIEKDIRKTEKETENITSPMYR